MCLINFIPKTKQYPIAAVSVLVLVLSMFIFGTVRVSYGDTCIRDAADFNQGNICSAGDVRISNFEVLSGPPACIIGEPVFVDIKLTIESGPDRFDIGIYVDEEGGNAMDRGNSCFRDYLHQVDDVCGDTNDEEACPGEVNLSSGMGNYYNGEIGLVDSLGLADSCGDVPGVSDWVDVNPSDIATCSDGSGNCLFTKYEILSIEILCSDQDDDGIADVGACTSWDQKANSNCEDQEDTIPGTSSKCNCEFYPVGEIVALDACGDDIVDSGEECDDGNTDPGDGCSAICTIEECGNGTVDLGEDCDDGNADPGDGCRADCTIESCGDDIVDPGEECDDGNNVNGDGCQANCLNPVCGDDIVDPGEECDDGNTDAGDGCNDCIIEVCGDGVVNNSGAEQCDDGNTVGGDGCSADCTIEQQDVLICDVDGDGDIDRNDTRAIISARYSPASVDDPRDEDGDGTITPLDAKMCARKCTLRYCASP